MFIVDDEFKNDIYANYAVYDLRNANQTESLINIFRTIFVIILLTVGSYYFNKDARRLILDPIERITEKVKIMASDPLAVINGELENSGVLSLAAKAAGQQQQEDKFNEAYILE